MHLVYTISRKTVTPADASGGLYILWLSRVLLLAGKKVIVYREDVPNFLFGTES